MTVHELTSGLPQHGLIGFVTSYLNFREQPKRHAVKKEDLLFGAWATTGKHLRKVLQEYEQETQATQGRRSTLK